MSTNYPASFDNFQSISSSAPRNNPSVAATATNLGDAIDAIEQLLGQNPLGGTGYATLKAWLQDLAAGASVPTGTMIMWPGGTAPTGYLLCQGQSLVKASYTNLYAVVGDSYTASPGGANFSLPDLRQRLPLGKNASTTLGQTGGQLGHAHNVNPPATDTTGIQNESQTTMPSSGGGVHGGAHTHNVDITSFNSGTGDPPYIVVNFAIKT